MTTTRHLTYRSYPTPLKPLTVVAETHPEPAVVAAGFCPVDDLLDRLSVTRHDVAEVNHLDPFEDDILAYLGGDGSALERVETRQAGTAMQQQVWSGLRAIPAGQTATYRDLAAATDSPNAIRAAGSACGRNLIAPFVPCHRALRSDGSLGGYLYGLEIKQWLLELEGATPSVPGPGRRS